MSRGALRKNEVSGQGTSAAPVSAAILAQRSDVALMSRTRNPEGGNREARWTALRVVQVSLWIPRAPCALPACLSAPARPCSFLKHALVSCQETRQRGLFFHGNM